MRKVWMRAQIVEEPFYQIDSQFIFEAATKLLVKLMVLRNYQNLEAVAWLLLKKALR